MTRKRQKEVERQILDAYLNLRAYHPDRVQEFEAPDFLVDLPSERLGIEILEYHSPNKTQTGHTRRQVESAWEDLRRYVATYRENEPRLDQLSVHLTFKKLEVPNKKELGQFVDAVAEKIYASGPPVDMNYHYLEVDDSDPEILVNYIRTIRLRRVKAYLEWDWNFDAGPVGASEQELIEALRPKLLSFKPLSPVDSTHLVVAGWAGRMSEIIAPVHVEQFRRFFKLNGLLQESRFDVVVIICFQNLQWDRTSGWSELPSH